MGSKVKRNHIRGLFFAINQWRNERENLRKGIWSKDEFQGRTYSLEDGYGRHTA